MKAHTLPIATIATIATIIVFVTPVVTSVISSIESAFQKRPTQQSCTTCSNQGTSSKTTSMRWSLMVDYVCLMRWRRMARRMVRRVMR